MYRGGVGREGKRPLLGEYEIENRKTPHLIEEAESRGWEPPGVEYIACGLPALPELTHQPEASHKRLAAPVKLIQNVGTMPKE